MDTNEPSCRICCQKKKSERLTTICACRGTNLYHLSCLQRWLETKLSDECDVCRGKYQAVIKTKPATLIQSFKSAFSTRDVISASICTTSVFGLVYFFILALFCWFNIGFVKEEALLNWVLIGSFMLFFISLFIVMICLLKVFRPTRIVIKEINPVLFTVGEQQSAV